MRPEAAENFAALLAAIWMRSPVAGLTPWRAARSETLNLPKPAIATSPPFCSSLAIVSNTPPAGRRRRDRRDRDGPAGASCAERVGPPGRRRRARRALRQRRGTPDRAAPGEVDGRTGEPTGGPAPLNLVFAPAALAGSPAAASGARRPGHRKRRAVAGTDPWLVGARRRRSGSGSGPGAARTGGMSGFPDLSGFPDSDLFRADGADGADGPGRRRPGRERGGRRERALVRRAGPRERGRGARRAGRSERRRRLGRGRRVRSSTWPKRSFTSSARRLAAERERNLS